MGDPIITNNDVGGVILDNPQFRDDVLTLGGAKTVLAGTILARQAVEIAIVAAADGGNTGDGTVTLASVVAGQVVPLPGGYNLECVEAVADGGVFKLEDPNGAIIASNLYLMVGAGGATIFEVGGMIFTVTDGATNFALGDKFSLTLTADGNLVPFEKNGAGGAQVPKVIITYPLTVTGAGDSAVRVGVLGEYRKEKLVIDSDGDDSNIDSVVIDQLRDYGLTPVDVKELNIADNQ